MDILDGAATESLPAQIGLIAVGISLHYRPAPVNFAVFHPFDVIAFDGCTPTILGLAFIDPAHLVALDRLFCLIVLASHGAIFGIELGVAAGAIH